MGECRMIGRHAHLCRSIKITQKTGAAQFGAHRQPMRCRTMTTTLSL